MKNLNSGINYKNYMGELNFLNYQFYLSFYPNHPVTEQYAQEKYYWL